MNQDTLWQLIRYGLIAAGSFFVGKGYITSEQVTTVVGAIGAIFPVLWGLYVKFGTKSTTVEAAQRSDVPTVSGATGTVQK
jgi:hypothetical protein